MRRDLDGVFTTPIQKAATPQRTNRPPANGAPRSGVIAVMLGGIIIALGIGAFFVFNKVGPTNPTAPPIEQKPATATATSQAKQKPAAAPAAQMPPAAPKKNAVTSAPPKKTATPVAQPDTRPLEQFLVGTKWRWRGSGASQHEVTFLGDGTLEMEDWTRQGLVTGWRQISPNEVELTIMQGRNKNATTTITFTEDRSSFSGMDYDKKHMISMSPRIEPRDKK